MRTSIDLPDELFREAKVEAIRRGISLKDLMTDAIAKELHPVPSSRRLLDFPLIKASEEGPLDITPEILRQVEDDDDRARGGFKA